MAEALISLLVEQLSSVVYHHTNQGVKLVLNAEKDVEKFSGTLKLIQNVLQDAEKKQVSDSNVKGWLDQLKDVSYKMNDVLDAWNTEIGKRQAEKHERQPSDERKVRFSFPSYCMCLPHFSEVTRRYKIGSTIKDLNEELDQIYIDKNKYSLQSTMPAAVNVEQPPNPRSITTSLVDISTIFGRQVEKDGLVSKLVRKSVRGESSWSDQLVIPIVGMGGLGKTTFTQLIFGDAEVQAHFDKKAWVCVSDPFDVIKIAKEIFEHVKEEKNENSSDVLEILLRSIRKHIEGKKFLLVLDDVWTENQTEWDRLSLPVIMRPCAKGSRILVTTRKLEVAQMMRATSDMIINLGKLNESDSLELFNSVAFMGREQDKSNKGFGDTAKKIVRKCGGLPLVLKTLGGLLLHKQTIREWEEVLYSEIWKIKVVQEDVFRPLLLSYYDLAPEIKSCLLYCSTFPKDFEFSIEMLIELWMSQGYLNVGENREETTEGREVFNKLVLRCFFQDFQKNTLTKEIIGCKMHDTVHDFVQYLTQNECYTMEYTYTYTHGMETSSANDTTKPRPGDKVRHLTLKNAVGYNLPSFISSIVWMNCEILRTLTTFYSQPVDYNLIRRLKRLRTLNLGGNHIVEVPEEIGDLMHLRYIDLSRNWLRELPDSVCNLYNLQTLRLDYCTNLEKLPDNMGKLINLKHLHVDSCLKLSYLPKGIGSIRNLRTLDDAGPVYCSESENAVALTLGDLSMMNQLRRLSIKIERIGEDAASKAEKAELRKKEHLSHLKLVLPEWRTFDDDEDVGVIDALQPHENLESLMLYYYNGSSWPTWMTTSCLTRLTALHLNRGRSSVLPPLGKLPSLKVLKLMGIDRLKEIGGDFFGVEETSSSSSFPSLETLVLDCLWEFEKWELGRGEAEDSCNSQMKSISIMPCLSSLYIVDCSKLKQLPDFLLQNAPLQNLLIQYCGSFGSLPDEFKSRIPNVTIIGFGVDPFIKGRKIDYGQTDSNLIRQLKRLRTLNLIGNDIKEVPEEIGDLMHLRYIDLSGNELRELPDSVCNLYNLQTLRLDYCTNLEKLPNNMGKLINLKHLHVDYCPALRYLPKGIGSIRNLRTLGGNGRVYCSEDAEALTLGDLSMMNQLRRLSIRIERIGEDAASMAKKAELRKKELLSHLKLFLSEGEDDNLHAGVIDALQPHENLESLMLYYYNGSTWPTWMTTSYLTRLTALHLDYCRSSVLPPLGRLQSLKVLKLSGNFSLEEIGGEFFGVEETSSSSFPSLETLVLDNLWEFEKWELGRGEAEDSCNSQMKSISIMPRLSSLYIVRCDKLKQLPDFLLQNAPLQNLLIDDCDSFGSLPDEFKSRIPNVTIIGSGVDPFIQGRKVDYDPLQD